MKKRVFNAVMTGALSLGVLGAAALPALAASDSAAQGQAETVMAELRSKLKVLGVELPERKSPFAGLDEAAKAKAEAVMKQKQAGELTEAEAQAELEALGVTVPERNRSSRLAEAVEKAELDETAQAKADAVLAQLEEKAVTKAEAKEQLLALGVDIKEGKERGGFLTGLDDETKAKAEALMKQVKSGELTREEAAEQLEALGIDLPLHGHGGRHGQDRSEAMLEGLDEAAKAEAKNLIEAAEQQLEELGIEKSPIQ